MQHVHLLKTPCVVFFLLPTPENPAPSRQPDRSCPAPPVFLCPSLVLSPSVYVCVRTGRKAPYSAEEAEHNSKKRKRAPSLEPEALRWSSSRAGASGAGLQAEEAEFSEPALFEAKLRPKPTAQEATLSLSLSLQT